MAVITQKKIQVLGVGQLETARESSATKYGRRALNVWTGSNAGVIQVYAEKGREGDYSDIENLPVGEYTVDIVERHGDYGVLEMVFQNPKPVLNRSNTPKQQ